MKEHTHSPITYLLGRASYTTLQILSVKGRVGVTPHVRNSFFADNFVGKGGGYPPYGQILKVVFDILPLTAQRILIQFQNITTVTKFKNNILLVNLSNWQNGIFFIVF